MIRNPVIIRILCGMVLILSIAGGIFVTRPLFAHPVIGLAGGVLVTGNAPNVAAGSGFIYQGVLTVGGVPANGSYDFQVNLWDAVTGGTPIGNALSVTGQPVTNGVFTIPVDFGSSVFQGDARWLQLAVRQNSGIYTLLTPRQPISATPYAMSLIPGATLRNAYGSPLFAVNNTGTGRSIQGISTSNDGVYGETASAAGGVVGINTSNGAGVFGRSANGNGIAGEASSGAAGISGINNNVGAGVYGLSISGEGVHGSVANTSSAVAGINTGTGPGVYGRSSGGNGISGEAGNTQNAIFGNNTGNGVGVYGTSSSGAGVVGVAGANQNGVYGSNTNNGAGVYGHSTTGDGVHGETSSLASGVIGINTSSGSGVYGRSTGGEGVRGDASSSSSAVTGVNSGSGVGVYGNSSSGDGVVGMAGANRSAVYGNNTSNGSGVYGSSSSGAGVSGNSTTGTGVYGASTSGPAGVFQGNVQINGNLSVSGNLSKGGGSFKIDDPLDPANKYLSHSFVESPDMKNIYDGIAVLDATGSAWVTMPQWFQALNRDFRYQLTPIGAPMGNLYIAQEIQDNRFQIAGGKAGLKVSWQVTGIRQDPYANTYRILVEEAKPATERGYYLHPEVYGEPAAKRIQPAGAPVSP